MRLIDANALQFEPKNGVLNGVLFMGRATGKTLSLVQSCLEAMINNAPTIDAALVKHGRWVEMVDGKLDTHTGEYWEEVYYNCLECDYASDWKSPYCPQCGAKMHELNDKFDGAKAITVPKWEG